MSSERIEQLRAADEAARILDKFPPRGRTSFDVVKVIEQLGIPLLFGELDGLLGGWITSGEEKGIIVTARRPLAIQRFTMAHELGHCLLGHPMSMDIVEGDDAELPIDPKGPDERHASAFASELLGARDLVFPIAKRQRWRAGHFEDPVVVYQLGLRLGLSFTATCWALARGQFLARPTAQRLVADTTVGDLKRALVGGAPLQDARADVWALTKGDEGTTIECGPKDTFAVKVRDQTSSGFVWKMKAADGASQIVGQETTPAHRYGEGAVKSLLIRCREVGRERIVLEQVRPWNQETLSSREWELENFGREAAGLPRHVRELRLQGGPEQ